MVLVNHEKVITVVYALIVNAFQDRASFPNACFGLKTIYITLFYSANDKQVWNYTRTFNHMSWEMDPHQDLMRWESQVART